MVESRQGREQGQRRTAPGSLSPQVLHELLVDSSRTFALAIPLLESALRREVTIAYLLFRIADTLEDGGALWSRRLRLAGLEDFDRLLEQPDGEHAAALAARWSATPPTDHAGYRRLLDSLPGVIASWRALPADSRRCIGRHTRRTATLMSEFVSRGDDDGVLELESLGDLRSYCYAVAGIVGEMLTELFILASPALAETADGLRSRAALFGEGLQLVNILKDSEADAREGRIFIPSGVDRSAVFGLARKDLESASEYVLSVQDAGGPEGIVAFTALPVELARATLDAVERKGPGAKISRQEVLDLYEGLCDAIAAGRPALGRPERHSTRGA